MKSETLTSVLVNLAGIMERADESLLPGVYKEFGAALNAVQSFSHSLSITCSIILLPSRCLSCHATQSCSFLYCTYPRDRERPRMVALEESEMQLLEVEDCTREEYCEIYVLESNELNGKESKSKIDRIDYPTEENIDLDDNDEKVLLSR